MENKRKILMGFALAAMLVAFYLIYESFTYVSTDNAQIQAKTVMLSPKVSGYVTKVLVEENQQVKAGEVLAELDTRDYQNSLTSSSGELQSVLVRLRDAEKNYKRLSELVKSGAVSQQQFDSSEATYRELNNRYKAMQAQYNQANLNVEYTQIRAPSDGVVARRSAEVGMLAAAGTPLFGFVSSDLRWVNANFKETELKDIKVGNRVDVSVDAIRGKKYVGKVESISPSTGATFTLLPPDNATGNFTKIVQRVPVRIALEGLKPEEILELRAGLSAVVSVHIR